MTDFFLYGSSYWCEHCNLNHAVAVWGVERKDGSVRYEVTDMDGDLVDDFDNLDILESLYPEDAPAGDDLPEIPEYEYVTWHAIVNKDLEVLRVAPIHWLAAGMWIKAKEAPEEVRWTLSLPKNPEDGNRIAEGTVKTFADLENGLKKYISGGFVRGGYDVTGDNEIYFVVKTIVKSEEKTNEN